MAETTIEWTATRGPDGVLHPGFTMNGWIGCEEVSPECDNCYARQGSRRLAAAHGLTLWPGEPGGASDRFFTGDDYWRKPFAWARKAAALGVRLKVFAFSFGDVFERRLDLIEPRNRLMRVIEATPQLDWLLLTKRPENMVELAHPVWPGAWPANVWAGATVGVSKSLERVAHLQKVPARLRFLSMEPLLEDVSLDGVFGLEEGSAWRECVCAEIDPSDRPCLTCDGRRSLGERSGIHWVICGGESGAIGKARPLDLHAVRRLRDACKGAGVPFFTKQMGHWLKGDPTGFRVDNWRLTDGRVWVPGHGEGFRTRPDAEFFSLYDKHGGDMGEWPEAYRVREQPTPREWPAAA